MAPFYSQTTQQTSRRTQRTPEGSTKENCRQEAGGAHAIVGCGSRLRAFGPLSCYQMLTGML
ncbi:MAG TPA: hypothetical protein VEP28_00435, partial [Rubrobacter sp.]|nr:hypothetical protein [Rubrobacter sp.]